ncbi:hypothetical protein V1478_007919 [Vespula squamosa]|uniref:Uncharacterized protein n=1 Tax=Vespula squamosa TaxID=30214 RepID=A0ABD2AXA6_VESSQ
MTWDEKTRYAVENLSCRIGPDLNPLDFYLWRHLQSVVYKTPVNSVERITLVKAEGDLPLSCTFHMQLDILY